MTNNPDSAVHVFLSHKHEDEGVARALKESLDMLGPGRLTWALSEDMPAGTDWLRWIKDQLRQANLLFFLFTNRTTDWDWCLYEAGLFEGIAQGKGGRIVVLHRPGIQPPSPLRNLQAVQATKDRMIVFLRQLFGTPEITGSEVPLNSPFAASDKALADVATTICALFVNS